MEPENDLWVEFARSMAPMAALPAHSTALRVARPGRQIKVLDIAAGHGLFGLSVARLNPSAEIYAVDWAKVLVVAKDNAARFGILDRFHLIPGSAFDVHFGDSYDLVLVPNFFHHFDERTNIELLKKIRRAMNPESCPATIEFVPNDDRVSPFNAALFSMVMLARTKQGDAYTLGQFEGMFRAAGFGQSQMETLEPTPLSLILTSFDDLNQAPSAAVNGRNPNRVSQWQGRSRAPCLLQSP